MEMVYTALLSEDFQTLSLTSGTATEVIFYSTYMPFSGTSPVTGFSDILIIPVAKETEVRQMSSRLVSLTLPISIQSDYNYCVLWALGDKALGADKMFHYVYFHSWKQLNNFQVFRPDKPGT